MGGDFLHLLFICFLLHVFEDVWIQVTQRLGILVLGSLIVALQRQTLRLQLRPDPLTERSCNHAACMPGPSRTLGGKRQAHNHRFLRGIKHRI